VAGSELHERLGNAIERLRKVLLPDPFDPTGTYDKPDEVHLRAASFRVLVHAEMEAYVEEIASDLFQAAWAAWSERGTPSRVLLGLLAFSGRNHALPPSSLKDQGAELDVRDAIQKAQAVWRSAQRQNHGLKEENVLRLLLPLGIGAPEIDATLLSDLSSFGSARGEVAHTSVSKVRRYIDPESEYKSARQLAAGLLKLDELIQRGRAELERLDAATASSGQPPAQASVPPVAPAEGHAP
jgi:hypothetical protein